MRFVQHGVLSGSGRSMETTGCTMGYFSAEYTNVFNVEFRKQEYSIQSVLNRYSFPSFNREKQPEYSIECWG